MAQRTQQILEAVQMSEEQIDYALKLVDETAGPERTAYEGYTGTAAARKLREAKKLVAKARELLESVAQSVPVRKEVAS
ncbi:MAG TPA: hypothetical protein VGS01_09520 [Candidatus Limnocylindria bacterium]|jgi:hypothetical protein|nr:hypothetical protein [Candidatus Limnocylindria bacterium]